MILFHSHLIFMLYQSVSSRLRASCDCHWFVVLYPLDTALTILLRNVGFGYQCPDENLCVLRRLTLPDCPNSKQRCINHTVVVLFDLSKSIVNVQDVLVAADTIF